MNSQQKLVDAGTGEMVQLPQADPKAQAALFAKVARAMGTLGRLEKRGRHQHFNYEFVKDEDVYDAIRPALATEGIAFFAAIRHVDIIDVKTIVYQTFTFADGETGATYSCDWVSEAIDKQDKAIAKACTVGLKYFLLKTFILSTGDPTDDTDSGPVKEQKKAPAKTNSNGSEALKAAFFARAMRDIPYFENVGHVANALKKAGFTSYKQAQEDEMFAALEAHANQAANAEAA